MINKYFLIFYILFFYAHGIAWGGDYIFENNDKNILISYQVDDGYKIAINISVKKANAYQTYFEADYDGEPKVEFIDLNKDGAEDIIIKLTSEGEYSPLILINNGGNFVSALPKFDSITFSYDIYNESLYELGRPNQTPEFQLTDVNGDGIYELVFEHLIIEGVLEKNVVLSLDAKKEKYSRLKNKHENLNKSKKR